MNIKYDMLADAIYLRMTDAKIARTRKNSDTFFVDLDAKGDVVGIEILDVSSQRELLTKLKTNIQSGVPVSIESASPVLA